MIARVRLAGVAVGVLALSGVAGCGVDDAGAAVRVGATRVSDRQVADDVAQVKSQVTADKFDASLVTAATIRRLTVQALVDEAAARTRVTVTESDVDKLLSDAAISAGGMDKLEASLAANAAVPRDAVRDYARTYLEQTALGKKLAPTAPDAGAQAAVAYLASLSIDLDTAIAPRFGTWKPTDLAVGPAPVDLAAPAVAPTAAAKQP